MVGGFTSIVWEFLMKMQWQVERKEGSMNLVEAIHEMFGSLRKGLKAAYSKPKPKKKAKRKTKKKKAR